MKRILLSGKNGFGKFAIVDDGDFDYLNQWRWHLKDTGYAVRREKINGKNKTIYMHRLISDTPEGLFCDHKNRLRLDNRKDNLCNVSWAENHFNIGCHRDSNVKHRNIDFNRGRFRVRIQRYGKLLHQGAFVTLPEAITFRDAFL